MDNNVRSARRDNYINWEEYYMGVALLAAERSKDPSWQVGACVVDNDKKIISIGYNGMPTGCDDDLFPWDEEKKEYVCHAELNALVMYTVNFKGCIMYVTRYPCPKCTQIIIQSGIKKVIYLRKKNDEPISERMFEASEVIIKQYGGRTQDIVIKFDKEYPERQKGVERNDGLS